MLRGLRMMEQHASRLFDRNGGRKALKTLGGSGKGGRRERAALEGRERLRATARDLKAATNIDTADVKWGAIFRIMKDLFNGEVIVAVRSQPPGPPLLWPQWNLGRPGLPSHIFLCLLTCLCVVISLPQKPSA